MAQTSERQLPQAKLDDQIQSMSRDEGARFKFKTFLLWWQQTRQTW
jgi:hypothetical protein